MGMSIGSLKPSPLFLGGLALAVGVAGGVWLASAKPGGPSQDTDHPCRAGSDYAHHEDPTPSARVTGAREADPRGGRNRALSRVAITHHAGAHDGSPGRDNMHLIDGPVRMLVDEAVKAFAGTDTVVEAWQQIIPDPTKKVAIKINCQISGIFTKARVVMPIADGLIARGVPPDNIIIYDRNMTAFPYAGFTRDPGGPGVRTGVLSYGDFGGYSSHAEMYHIAKLLIDESGDYDCDYLINVPVCKALDGYSGVTMSLKNHYGTCDPRHGDIHNEICRTNALEPIRDKTRLVVLDACYCEYKWYNGRDQTWVDVVNKIIVSNDPVAVDYLGWQIIEQLRMLHGWPPVSPYPYFIDYAAEVFHLGTNDPGHMEIVSLELPLGDMNCDDVVNTDDIEPFVLALIDPAAYGTEYPQCLITRADINGDGLRDGDDLSPFAGRLLSP